jgi:hypothetical protein
MQSPHRDILDRNMLASLQQDTTSPADVLG